MTSHEIALVLLATFPLVVTAAHEAVVLCPRPRWWSYRKIGGLHFIALGRIRVSFCKVKG